MAIAGKDKKYNAIRFNPRTSFLAVLNSNDESDINVVLAKYFLENFHRIADISIYQVAEECYTSRSSVQRFIKSIGYDTFTSLKESTAEVFSHQTSYHTYADHTDYPDYLMHSVTDMMADINNMAKKQRLIRLAENIHDCRNVFIVSAEDSSSAARIFQQQMLSMNRLIRIVTSSAHTNPEVINTLDENDCVITCSASGNYALTINNEMQDIKAHKTLVTLNRTTLFEATYDYIFYLSGEFLPSNRTLTTIRNVYTRYGMSYFFDLLFHYYYARYQNEVQYL
ncbi:MAG: MurR/RpiR family transcriptional regulator [Solobacterium sp.]|nr:MurR/RpiR family transcriptional regulator [Solobacterium sp.]